MQRRERQSSMRISTKIRVTTRPAVMLATKLGASSKRRKGMISDVAICGKKQTWLQLSSSSKAT